jgi:hypothetical protein
MKPTDQLPTGPILSILFPKEPRRFAGQRWVKIILRSLHVLCAGIYVGAFVFGVEKEPRTTWFLATLGSGASMLLVDLFESGAFLLQIRGVVVMTKLILLACISSFGSAAVWVLAGVGFFSVISSHASSTVRYFMVWGRGRIKGAETKG